MPDRGFVAGAVALVLVAVTIAFFHEFLWRVVWPKGVMGVDHRGREVEFLDFNEMPTRVGLTREQGKRVAKAARRRPKPATIGLVVLAWAVPFGIHVWLPIELPTAAGWALGLLWFALGVVVVRVVRVVLLRWYNPALVVIGRCPSCGYDLTELPREHDGCVVCPECGAAWAVGGT